MKKFYESQEKFEKWREIVFIKCVPLSQIYDDKIMIEKWEMDLELYTIEILPNGNGFSVYKKMEV